MDVIKFLFKSRFYGELLLHFFFFMIFKTSNLRSSDPTSFTQEPTQFTLFADTIRLVYKHVGRILGLLHGSLSALTHFTPSTSSLSSRRGQTPARVALEPTGEFRRRFPRVRSSACLTRLPFCLHDTVTRGDQRGPDTNLSASPRKEQSP